MKPFRISIPDEAVADLHLRLEGTRWPDEVPDTPWARGVPVDYLAELAAAWRDLDWRAVEAELNSFPQYVTEIDGTSIHFLHVRSPEEDAVPLVMTHGWPGTFAEFASVIGPLTDPRGHGLAPEQAYHVVVPSLPGFGFSGPPVEPGWGVGRVAAAWLELMGRLGYDRFVAHGTDLGTWVSIAMAAMAPERVRGVHVNFLVTPPVDDAEVMGQLTPDDLGRLQQTGRWIQERSGYMWIQSTKPQTLSYGLTDSPVGQLAWIAEKYWEWTAADRTGVPTVSMRQLLTAAAIYWFTRSAGSSAQIYYELSDQLPISPNASGLPPVQVPLGVAVYAFDANRPVRALADAAFPTVVHWSEFPSGGHFPALEEPGLFVSDLRGFHTDLRAAERADTAAA